MDFLAGEILLFDKPAGWTSFDVVNKVRGAIRVKKVGHAGTLDPLATGLLILCTGKATKQIESIQGQEKEYEVVFKLGATTASYDAECPEENLCDASHIREEGVAAALPPFTGEISQIPPIYSAVKVNGKRAYEAARKGETLELKARTVHIYTFELLPRPGHLPPEEPFFAARIRCSKGTYIRTLVHDLGQALGVGAYMTALVRTRIGAYSLADAWQIPAFTQAFGKKALP